MCVILLVDTKKPSEDMVEACWNANANGGGVAWREGGLVKWKKGLELAQMQELCAVLPIPYVAHFRIPSAGGASKSLCHPFIVNEKCTLDMEGSTKSPVLFHNGTWTDWRKTCLQITLNNNLKVPTGARWSDSRAMAWMAARYGTGFLEFLDEKVVIFAPNDIDIFGGQWSRVHDIWCSNLLWEGRMRKSWKGGEVSYPTSGKAGATTSGGYHGTAPASLLPNNMPLTAAVIESTNKELACIPPLAKDTVLAQFVKGGGKIEGNVEDVTKSILGLEVTSKEHPFPCLGDAEEAHKQGHLSKNKLKKERLYFRKLEEDLDRKQARELKLMVTLAEKAVTGTPA
jgi:hypothetical protein